MLGVPGREAGGDRGYHEETEKKREEEEAKRGLQGMVDVAHVKRQSPNILVHACNSSSREKRLVACSRAIKATQDK